MLTEYIDVSPETLPTFCAYSIKLRGSDFVNTLDISCLRCLPQKKEKSQTKTKLNSLFARGLGSQHQNWLW